MNFNQFSDVARMILQSSSDSDESDYDFEVRRFRRPRFIKERISHFHDLDDLDFSRRFRLSKSSTIRILDLIDHKLRAQTDRNDAIAPLNQLLLAFRFYATGCTQLAAADFAGVSEPSACRIIHRVSDALACLYTQNVFMPRNQDEISRTQRDFYRIARFPSVIGAVDGTHIKIRSPGGEHAEYYRNRKGYFSLNVQGICNTRLEFLDVVARWPGSTHDQTIFDHSRTRAYFESNRFGKSILLGDSAYANRQYMMTPFDNPSTPAEELYNESQIRSRNPVERVFGVWKRRFPALAVGINVRLDKVQPIIIATAVLHNILLRDDDPMPPDDNSIDLPLPWAELMANQEMEQRQTGTVRRIGAPHRQLLVDNYFSRL